jgi:hypothetical protein
MRTDTSKTVPKYRERMGFALGNVQGNSIEQVQAAKKSTNTIVRPGYLVLCTQEPAPQLSARRRGP